MQLEKFQVDILKEKQDLLKSEQLISRLIDRPIRPLFPSSFMNEVQLLPTVLSYDGENQADVLSIIACFSFISYFRIPLEDQ